MEVVKLEAVDREEVDLDMADDEWLITRPSI